MLHLGIEKFIYNLAFIIYIPTFFNIIYGSMEAIIFGKIAFKSPRFNNDIELAIKYLL